MKVFGRRRKEAALTPSDIELCDDQEACDKALARLLPAAEGGDAESQYLVGRCHHLYPATGRSYEEAFRWYSAAADHGHAGALFGLGTMYENGLGVPQSRSKAASCFLKAAEKGHPQAQYEYASLCEGGDVDGASMEDAYHWYAVAAENGVDAAILALERLKGRWIESSQSGLGTHVCLKSAWPQRLTSPPRPSLPFRFSTLLSRKRQWLEVRLLPSGPDPVPPMRHEQRPSGRLPC